jgi:hypothetical protein
MLTLERCGSKVCGSGLVSLQDTFLWILSIVWMIV